MLEKKNFSRSATPCDSSAGESNSDHSIQIPGTEWQLWRTVCVRGAGFPADDVLLLGDETSAVAADRLISTERQMEKVREEARDMVRRKVALLVDDLARSGSDEAQRLRIIGELRSARSALDQLDRRQVHPRESNAIDAEACSMLEQDTGLVESQKREFDERYAEGKRRIAASIVGIANDERFREAVTWQSVHALRTAVDPLARSDAATPSNRSSRRREELVAGYLQRYCTKNDTIGFFGPVGWATISSHVDVLQVTPQIQRLATRQVYFEEWPIRALAQRLSADARYRPWFFPRMMPFLRVEGGFLYPPLSRAVELSRSEAAVLTMCDGTRMTCDIVNDVIANSSSGLRAESEVLAILDGFQQRRRISWGIEAPVGDARPECHLRRQLERIGDDSLRVAALELLDELEVARGRVASAAGKTAELETALGALNRNFERAAGTSSVRRHGATYGARTLVYLDCRRDLQMEIGEQLLNELCEPLIPVLESARWFTHTVARRFEAALADVFSQTCGRYPSSVGNRSVDMPNFWLNAQSLFHGKEALSTADVEAELCARWKTILAFEDGQRRVHLRSSELKEGMKSLFHTGNSGWHGGRYHSPDLMLMSPSLEDLKLGNVTCVLGEIHAGLNTMLATALVNQHPHPATLLDNVRRDLGRPRLMTYLSREGTQQTVRTEHVVDPEYDRRIVFSHDICLTAPNNVLTSGDLVVEHSGERLIVRTRDGRQEFQLLDVFGQLLSPIVATRFRLLQQRSHSPRITVDKMILQRETWQVPYLDFSFAFEATEEERFIGARRWVSDRSVPRFVFVKFPWEQKPVYLDFSSPIYVRMFCKHLCNAKARALPDDVRVRISEMLPAHENLWLKDERGKRYTSEFRMVFVDGAH